VVRLHKKTIRTLVRLIKWAANWVDRVRMMGT
jgi:hypothetical protein